MLHKGLYKHLSKKVSSALFYKNKMGKWCGCWVVYVGVWPRRGKVVVRFRSGGLGFKVRASTGITPHSCTD